MAESSVENPAPTDRLPVGFSSTSIRRSRRSGVSVTAGTIAFDLAKGDAYSGKKVMAWESGSKPAGVLFTRTGSGYYGVTAQDDGVYAISGGIMVIIR